MIIDLSASLKDNPEISIVDYNGKTLEDNIFSEENALGFLFNIEVCNLVIEVIKEFDFSDKTSKYSIYVWNTANDTYLLNKQTISSEFVVKEIIYSIKFCQKYKELIAFA